MSEKIHQMPEIVDFLHNLPQNTILHWSETHQKLSDGVHSASWCDIYQPELCEMLQWSWVWTINSPNEELTNEDDEPIALWAPPEKVSQAPNDALLDWFNLALPVDRVVGGVQDPEGFFENEMLDSPRTTAIFGHDFDEKELSDLEQAAKETKTSVVSQPGWSTESINNILSQWVQETTGRTDILFEEDENLLSPSQLELNEILEKIDEGEANTYKIGENIMVTEQAMDSLLEMGIDASAEIMAELNEIVNTLKNEDPNLD